MRKLTLTTETRTTTRHPRPPKDPTSDLETIARLRREKDELTWHLHIYEDHIRRLTVENAMLIRELETVTGVARLHRPPHL